MRLSKHFTLREMTRSQTATRLGIDNMPTDEHIENLIALCENILEPVREYYNVPVRISSGYRSSELNKAIGGSRKSQHSNGMAADFEVGGHSNYEVALWISENCDFDQLILEFYNPEEGPNSGWIHASYHSPEENRHQILTALRVSGKTVYKPGFVV